MRGKMTLYIDQWGNKWYVKSVRELHRVLGGKRPSKMYRDTPAGTIHTGYVVGRHWCTAYVPYENAGGFAFSGIDGIVRLTPMVGVR